MLIVIAALVFYQKTKTELAASPTPTETPTPTPTPIEHKLLMPAGPAEIVGSKFVLMGSGTAFENSFSYRIVDGAGKKIDEGSLMTNAKDAGLIGYYYKEIDLAKLSVSLPASVTFDVFEASAKDGSDIQKISRSVAVDKNQTTIFAYFNNSNLNPDVSCDKTFAVARRVSKTMLTLKASMEQLLKGVLPEEAVAGFTTLINPGTKLNSAKISGSTASLDFSKELDENGGGSCKVTSIRSQIENTAKQFPGVKKVIISINGKSDTILQP